MQTSAHRIKPIAGSVFLQRVFYCLAGLAVLSLCLAIGGRFLGHAIALGGHTEDATLQEIVIGNSVLELPANTIRFNSQRQSGVAERVDLYLRWPDMQGYQPQFIRDFNGSAPEKRLLFLTFEPRTEQRDMSGRYGPIYSRLTAGPGMAGPAQLTVQAFRPYSGFVNEELIVSPERAESPLFVARCLDEKSSASNLASCQRDILVGKDLLLTYRFPREMLKDWQVLDSQIMEFVRGHLRSTE